MNIPVSRPRGRPSEYPGLLLDYFSVNPGDSVDDFKKWFGTEDSYVYKIVVKMVGDGLLERLPDTDRYTRCRAAKPVDEELVAILRAQGPLTLDAVGPLYGCPPTYLLEAARRLRAEGHIVLRLDGRLSV
ncbi:MAG: hypothetical protein GY913_06535 [Proteobacteria bacterium]|nr:hypothetical protein [Pseudomonadota bacterium]MCP4916562.1 hypothetical protein [Pseudomonadota bacterium]